MLPRCYQWLSPVLPNMFAKGSTISPCRHQRARRHTRLQRPTIYWLHHLQHGQSHRLRLQQGVFIHLHGGAKDFADDFGSAGLVLSVKSSSSIDKLIHLATAFHALCVNTKTFFSTKTTGSLTSFQWCVPRVGEMFENIF